MNVDYERIESYSILLANEIKEQITVAPLIADSQATVSDSEAAAPASQL